MVKAVPLGGVTVTIPVELMETLGTEAGGKVKVCEVVDVPCVMVIVASLVPDATVKEGGGTSTVKLFPEMVEVAMPVAMPLMVVAGKFKVCEDEAVPCETVMVASFAPLVMFNVGAGTLMVKLLPVVVGVMLAIPDGLSVTLAGGAFSVE